MRERILVDSITNYMRDRPRLVAKLDLFLKLCYPNEKEREAGVALIDSLKPPKAPVQDYESDALAQEFNLPRRRMKITSTAEALASARKRLEEYTVVTTSLDSKERLDNLPVLDWLATTSADDLKETLQAHLENSHGELDEWIPSGDFAKKLIAAWSVKDWQACERFAWDAQMPPATRRRLLIDCFQDAAELHPDEIYARITQLIADGKMWSLALIEDGAGLQWGGSCYAGRIPIEVGKGWAVNDPKAAAKIAGLPPEWQIGAVKGAGEAFTKAELGVRLLEWYEAQDALGPNGIYSQFIPPGFAVSYRIGGRSVFKRLVEIDPLAARDWLEAVPARLTPSGDVFDGVAQVYRAMHKMGGGTAEAWFQHLHLDATVEQSK